MVLTTCRIAAGPCALEGEGNGAQGSAYAVIQNLIMIRIKRRKVVISVLERTGFVFAGFHEA